MFKKIKKVTIFFLLLIGSISLIVFTLGKIAPKPAERDNFEIIAHRGVHQDFKSSNKEIRVNKSYLTECTATRIYKPKHHYLENTVESIQAAFDYGATMVEIDIRPTKDNQLVVFHDWMLDCRTNGQGKVIDHNVEYLKTLDIGYGYTSDGKTFPFRGEGIGKIMTLSELLTKFHNKKFLIDNKNGNNLKTAQLIVDTLISLPENQQKLIYLWTQDIAFKYVNERVPLIKRLVLPRKNLKRFFKSYIFTLGMNRLEQYKNEGIGLPGKYVNYIWGWPNRFLGKLYNADMKFYIYINTITEAKNFDNIPINGIITDHIEDLGEYYLLRNRKDKN